MKKLNGSISIYFTFAIVLIISVIMSVTELARINCQKLYLQIATDAGLDSMASLYHIDLYNYYGIYGVEYKTKELLEKEFLSYIDPYFKDGNTYLKNWYVAKIDEDHIDLDYKTLVEKDLLDKDAVNFMKLKMIGKTIDFLGKKVKIKEESDIDSVTDEVKSIFDEVKKGNTYGEVYNRYFSFDKEIREVEDYARKISDYIDKANIKINNVKASSTSGTLSNGKSLLAKINALIDNITNLENALNNYIRKLDVLKEKISLSERRYISDKNSSTCSFDENVCNFIETEFDRFYSYVDDSSEIVDEIEEILRYCDMMKDVVLKDKEEIQTVVDILKGIEDDIKEESRLRGEERDNDLIDSLKDERDAVEEEFSDYIENFLDNYNNYKFEKMNIIVSSSAHTNEVNLIDKLIGFKDGVILNFVLDNSEIDKLSRVEMPIRKFNILSSVDKASVEKIILGEYGLDRFNYFRKSESGEITKSGSNNFEVERLIAEKNSDYDNLKSVVDKILLLRIGFNLFYIYTHSEKREEVRAFTNALFSGFSPLLAEAMFILVLTAWGTAQALADVKKLLGGHKVNLLHTESSWTVSLSNLLDIARNGIESSDDKDDEGMALSYKDYLRILLIGESQSDIDNRMAGIIESNLRILQNNFDFDRLIYSFDVNNDFICRHFFTNFVFVPAKDVILSDEYKISINAHRSFYE